MPIPTPKDGDASPATGPLDPSTPHTSKPGPATAPQWRSLGSGRYIDDRTGHLKYNPAEDPAHPLFNHWL